MSWMRIYPNVSTNRPQLLAQKAPNTKTSSETGKSWLKAGIMDKETFWKK
jgi:hypothetical protein